jgi:tRNA dimethylallyltransferase
VNARVDLMFSCGLIEEVKKLNQLVLSRTAGGLIGIPEVTGYLNGQQSLEEAKEAMKMNSRHYVKRQLTWFRKDKRLSWITVGPDESAGQVANRILGMIDEEGRLRMEDRR